MSTRQSILRQVMSDTDTNQLELSRISGVQQPRISQFLSGQVGMSDDMLERLLSCMGYQLEIMRRPVKPNLLRSPERSWRLHRRLSTHLTSESLDEWRPTILDNLDRLSDNVHGQPHEQNLSRWRSVIEHRELQKIHRYLTGLDRDSIEMREVSPMSGLLSQDERSELLTSA